MFYVVLNLNTWQHWVFGLNNWKSFYCQDSELSSVFQGGIFQQCAPWLYWKLKLFPANRKWSVFLWVLWLLLLTSCLRLSEKSRHTDLKLCQDFASHLSSCRSLLGFPCFICTNNQPFSLCERKLSPRHFLSSFSTLVPYFPPVSFVKNSIF